MKPPRFRFLQTGDLHIGRGRSSWGEAVALDRADKLFDQINLIAHQQDCHAILITGDVGDTKTWTTRERDLVARKLAENAGASGIPTFIISGNHDLVKLDESNLDFLAGIAATGEIAHLHVAYANTAAVWNTIHPTLKIVGAPVGISENQEPLEALLATLNEPGVSYIFMGHGTVGGSVRNDLGWRPSAAEDTKRLNLGKAAAKAKNVAWWAYGDIHKRQPLPGLPADAKGWYAGSPIQMDFGEKPDRGVLVIALDQTEDGWRYVGRRFIRVDDPAIFAPLVTVTEESQIDSLPPQALIRLSTNLVISEKRREQVVKTLKVVEDNSLPTKEMPDGELQEPKVLEVFDPLLADLATVEEEVLTDLPDTMDADVVSEAKKVIGKAVERFRARTYVS